ncbi:MAG: S41 family peptidase [Chitinispirillaceae bacterium]|nr:S41 family peptidase [Chitinispirillaceae bacterium]
MENRRKRFSLLLIIGLLSLLSCLPLLLDVPGLDKLQYEFAAKALDVFFIFRERLPSNLYTFNTPQELYEYVNEPYTQFFNKEMAKMFLSALSTEQEAGIGIRIDSTYNGYVIKDVFEGSPAEKSGLMKGDTIVRINDSSAVGLSWEKLPSLLRGDEGTEVVLRIKRGNDFRNIIVTRGKFIAPSVFIDSVNNEVAAIILTGFFTNTTLPGGSAEEFRVALSKTEWAKSTILDLRGNSGGYLEQCIEILGELLPPNTEIIKTHERIYNVEGDSGEEKDSIYRTTGSGSAANRNFYILVDSNTASASEIVTYSMINRKNVTVVGYRTYGKARGQVVLMGPDSVLAKVTNSLIIPLGDSAVSYDSIGIAPEVQIKEGEDAFDVALDLIEQTTPPAKRTFLAKAGRRPGRTDFCSILPEPLLIVTTEKIK